MILSKYTRLLIAPIIKPPVMGIAPVVVAGLISAGSGLINAWQKGRAAKKQRQEADRLEKQRKEKGLWTSPALDSALKMGKQAAYSSRSLDQGVEEASLRKQQAGQQYLGKMAGGSSAQKLANISSTGGHFTDRLRQMQGRGRKERYGRVRDYENMLMNKGLAEERSQARYEGAVGSLRGAAMQNTYGAWESVQGSIGDTLGTMAKNNMFDNWGKSDADVMTNPGATKKSWERYGQMKNPYLPQITKRSSVTIPFGKN